MTPALLPWGMKPFERKNMFLKEQEKSHLEKKKGLRAKSFLLEKSNLEKRDKNKRGRVASLENVEKGTSDPVCQVL